MASATSYVWSAFRPGGAGFGLAPWVIDGGLPDDELEDEEEEEPDELPDDAPLEPDVDELAPPELGLPPVELVEPVVTGVVEAVVLVVLVPLPNGLREGPGSFEFDGVVCTFRAGIEDPPAGGGVGI
jgi:hypothetical protein